MVKALHAAGIEVILDVVYNHTAEGNQLGPVYSCKGIDPATYYLLTDDPSAPYRDYSGTGNTFHSANPAAFACLKASATRVLPHPVALARTRTLDIC